MAEKERIRNKKKKRKPLAFATELSVLTLLVAAAFYAPQVVFQVQDTILCGAVSVSERTRMDVEALSTTYEKSLFRRMTNYAEELARDVDFYVASQDLPIEDEIYEYLESDAFLAQNVLRYFLDAGVIPYELWYRKGNIVVTEYKQYVIYSNDYAKGVNFILHYVEMLIAPDDGGRGIVFKVLADAETDTIYAFKTEYSDDSRQFRDYDRWVSSILISQWDFYTDYYEASFPGELDYEARFPGELDDVKRQLGMDIWEIELSGNLSYDVDSLNQQSTPQPVWENSEWSIRNRMTDSVLETAISVSDGNELCFRLPYGDEASLDMKLLIAEEDMFVTKSGFIWVYIYPDITMGIWQIYQFIPEFS